MTSASTFFDVILFLLSILVTDPSFMSLSIPVLELWQFAFDQKSGNWKHPRVLSNIWSVGQVRYPKIGTGVSYKMLLNAAKCQGYSFHLFWVIKGKPTGEGIKLPPPPPPRLGLKAAYILEQRPSWYATQTKLTQWPCRPISNSMFKIKRFLTLHGRCWTSEKFLITPYAVLDC